MARKKKDDSPAGGIVYFLSIFFLFILSVLTTFSFINWVFNFNQLSNWGAFLVCAVLGFLISNVALRGKFSVFIHEFKHKLTSGLAGNKAKRLSIEDEEGAFEYEYTKSTAHLNAFISLAPYYVPLFTTIAIGAVYIFGVKSLVIRSAIVGIAWGSDLSFNVRDISPHQTDFSGLRGGFTMGVLYVTLMNYVLFCFLASWISGGGEGVKSLLEGCLLVLHSIVTRYY